MPKADHQFLGFSHLRYPSASNLDVTFAHPRTPHLAICELPGCAAMAPLMSINQRPKPP